MSFLRTVLKDLNYRFRIRNRGAFSYFGTTVHFPRGSHIVARAASEGIYEREMLDTLGQFVRPGTYYLDIGANVGLLSVPILARFPETRVLSFEPAPTVVAKLQETCAGSRFADRWTVRPVGMGERPGTATLHVPAGGGDAFSATVPSRRHAEAEQFPIEISTIDAEWERVGRPPVSAIKIDVEGGERKVLLGGVGCITAHRPAILTEWNATNLAAHGESPDFLIGFCAEYGYRLLELPQLIDVREPAALRLMMRRTENFLLLPVAGK